MTFRPYQLAALALGLGLPSEPIARTFDRPPYSKQRRQSAISREERERRKAAKARAAASKRRNRR